MSNEIVKFSNQFNNVALKKFDAVHLDVLMAIASRVREKGTATVEFSFEELRGLMRLRKNLTNRQLADKIVQTNARLLALNYMFEDSGKIIQFALFTKFVTDPQEATLAVGVNEEFAFLLNDLTSQFTRFELAEFADLKSKYAKEFYRTESASAFSCPPAGRGHAGRSAPAPAASAGRCDSGRSAGGAGRSGSGRRTGGGSADYPRRCAAGRSARCGGAVRRSGCSARRWER